MFPFTSAIPSSPAYLEVFFLQSWVGLLVYLHLWERGFFKSLCDPPSKEEEEIDA